MVDSPTFFGEFYWAGAAAAVGPTRAHRLSLLRAQASGPNDLSSIGSSAGDGSLSASNKSG